MSIMNLNVTDWLPRDEPKRVAEEMGGFASYDAQLGVKLREVLTAFRKTTRRQTFSLLDVAVAESWGEHIQDSLSWAPLIENTVNATPSRVDFAVVIDGLLDAISDEDFERLDKLFAQIDVAGTHTDYLVALPSITFENREQIAEWTRLYRRVALELERRGVDVESELAGLDDASTTT